MTKKTIARLTRQGAMNLRGELVEMPFELRSGRNYQRGTTMDEKSVTFAGWNFYLGDRLLIGEEIHVGKTYTASAYIKPSLQDTNLMVHFTTSTGSFIQRFSTPTVPGRQEGWTNCTFVVPAGVVDVKLALRHQAGTTPSDTVSYKQLKLEAGTDVTPWTPAPEDLQIDTPIWVESAKNPMSIKEEGLVTHEFVEIPEELRGTGGRNLIMESAVPITSTSYSIKDYPLTEEITENELVTISIKGELNTNKLYFGIYNSGGNVSNASLTHSSKNSSGIYTGTFRWRIGASTNKFLRIYHMSSTVVEPSTIEWVKLEKGSGATLWSPAPEDLGYDLPKGVQNFGDPVELIGGRNLIRNSNKPVVGGQAPGIKGRITEEGYLEITASPGNGNYLASVFESLLLPDHLESGDLITVSVEMKGTTSTAPTLYVNSLTSYLRLNGELSPEFSTVSYTRVWRPGTGVLHFGFAGLEGVFHIKSIKIEKGEKITPWTPAPEDLGLVYGRDTQEFKGVGLSVNDKGISLGGEFSEVPDSIRFFGSASRAGYLKLPQEARDIIHGKEEATIEFWVKKLGSTGDYGLLQLSGHQNTNGNIYPYTTKTNVYLDVFKKNRLGPIEMNTSVNQLHHFAVTTKPGVEGWRVYQNGELIYTATGESTVSTNYLDFTIGFNSTNRYANGQFSDVKLWSVARSQQEIKESMQGVLGNKNGLMGYWKCNEGYGEVVYDHSGHERHGEIVGEVEWMYMMDEEG